MNKLALILALTCSVNLLAQNPYKFKYQAVARDVQGSLIKNDRLSFRISILKNSSSGTEVYSERHSERTNEFGLVNLTIGEGNTSDNFSDIDWSSEVFFLKVEMDPENGSDFLHMGTSQLLSVPFAINAKQADGITQGKELDTESYSAYADLVEEGTLDNNSPNDLLTTGQAEDLYGLPKIAFYVYNTASDIITNAGSRKLEFDAKKFDLSNNYNTGTDQFTAPVSGVYNFSTHILLRNVALTYYSSIFLNVNGVALVNLGYGFPPKENDYFTYGGSTSVHLQAGDKVDIGINCNDLSYTIYGSTAGEYTHFSGHLVFAD